MSELEFTGNVRRLRLRPGDTVVVELDPKSFISAADVQRIWDMLKPNFPDNKVLILAGGARVAAILRNEAA